MRAQRLGTLARHGIGSSGVAAWSRRKMAFLGRDSAIIAGMG